jgi:hypothetical protein
VTKGLIALTPEIDCDQTAMGLPPDTSQENSTSLFFPWMSYKVTKGLIAHAPDTDCEQTAKGLLPDTSAVFLLDKDIFVKRGFLREISVMPLLSFRGYSVSGMYVCI